MFAFVILFILALVLPWPVIPAILGYLIGGVFGGIAFSVISLILIYRWSYWLSKPSPELGSGKTL